MRAVLSCAGAMCTGRDDGSRHDFECVYNNHTFRVEVKNEDAFAVSDSESEPPNICIETRQGQPLRPSGISASEAVVCVHTFGDFCAIYRRREMYDYVRSRRQMEQPLRKSDNNNHGFVLPIKVLQDERWFDYCPLTALPKSVLWTY